jgi:hypothetical protein
MGLLYILPHSLQFLSFINKMNEANSYQGSKLTPEDGQGTPETCRVAKIK